MKVRIEVPDRIPSRRDEDGGRLGLAVTELEESPGRPLPDELRREMETRFGCDFSRVRIHQDARADDSARALGASAFTIGNDIYFQAGAFEPTRIDGRRLLAHELAHTIQQSAGERVPRLAAGMALASIAARRAEERQARDAAEVALSSTALEPPGTRGAGSASGPRACAGAAGVPHVARWMDSIPSDRASNSPANPFVEELALDVAHALQRDPDDAGAHTQRRLARLESATRAAVVARAQEILTPDQRERSAKALSGAAVTEDETAAAAAPAPGTQARSAEQHGERDGQQATGSDVEQPAPATLGPSTPTARGAASAAVGSKPGTIGGVGDRAARLTTGKPPAPAGTPAPKVGGETELAAAAGAVIAPGAATPGLAGKLGGPGGGADQSPGAGSAQADSGEAGGQPDLGPADALESKVDATTKERIAKAEAKGEELGKKQAAETGPEPAGLSGANAAAAVAAKPPEQSAAEAAADAHAHAEAQAALEAVAAEEPTGPVEPEPAVAPAAGGSVIEPSATDGNSYNPPESGPVAESDDAERAADVERTPEPEPIAEPEPAAEASPDAEAEPEATPEAEPTPEPEPAAEMPPAAELQPAAEPAAAPASEPEPAPVATESAPTVEPTPTPAPAPTPEPAPSADHGPEAVPDSAPAIAAEATAAERDEAPAGDVTAAASEPEPAEADAPPDPAGADQATDDTQTPGGAEVTTTAAGGEGETDGSAGEAPAAGGGSGDCGPDSAPGVGGGDGGGAPIADPQPEPEPDVSRAQPEDAMATVATLAPGPASRVLRGVQSASDRAVAGKRDDLAANPPSLERPTGSPQTRGGGPGAPHRAAVTISKGGRADRAHARGKAPKTVPPPLPPAPPSPVQAVRPPAFTGNPQTQMTPEQAQAFIASIWRLPVTDPGLNETAGPPPTVELTGDANPDQVTERRAKLDASVGAAATDGQQQAAAPMGEHDIYPAAKPETLRAQVPQSSRTAGARAAGPGAKPAAPGATAAAPGAQQTAGGAAGAPGAAGAGPDPVEIIAKEQSAADVQAAANDAQGQMTTSRDAQESGVDKANADAQAQIDKEVQANAKQQADQRGQALTQVAGERKGWTTEQHDKLAEHQAAADEQTGRVDTEVIAKRREVNRQAAAEIDDGNRKAADAKREGEAKAEAERKKGEEESSGGVLGWIEDKARAAFNAIKSAIKAAFDWARKKIREAIDWAIEKATQLIDAARDAIVSAIHAIGDALLALGDVFLSAFPSLHERYRKKIHELVDRAVAKVDELADALKEKVKDALNALASAIDAVLAFYERALLAAVDLVQRAVEGAIEKARAFINMLEQWGALIADIASAPMQWLSHLGSSALDGIRNHLWKAFKCQVKEWVGSTVQEVVGVPLELFKLLARGGIAFGQVVSMVWEGLIPAIPGILIELAIEQIVKALVPAFGAIMAIIDGLRAAWGTIKRIIAAFEKFFAFLRAVKLGNAGRQFAELLAMAAIVVLDFLSKYLIGKLMKPAKPIGGRLQALGKKIMARLSAVGKAVKRGAQKAVRAVKAGVRKAAAAVRKTAVALKQTAAKAGRTIAKVAGRVGHTVKRGARRVTAAVRKGAGRAMRVIEKRFPRVARLLKRGSGLVRRVTRRVRRSWRRAKAWARRKKQQYQRWRAQRRRRRQERQAQRLRAGVHAAVSFMNRWSGRRVARWMLAPALLALRVRYRLRSLQAVQAADRWKARGSVNPEYEEASGAYVLRDPSEAAVLFLRRATEAEAEFFGTRSLVGPASVAQRGGLILPSGPPPTSGLITTTRLVTPGTPLRGRQLDVAYAQAIATGNRLDITGVSSAEFVQTQLRHIQERGIPTGRLNLNIGPVTLTHDLRGTPSNPLNTVVSHTGGYGLEGGMSLPTLAGRLRGRGVSDPSISELMTTASRTGEPITPELLQMHGYMGGPARELNAAANRLTRASHLEARVESLRFLTRGMTPRQALPVATTMAMGHQLVQGLGAPIESLVGRGELDEIFRRPGAPLVANQPAPPVLNPANPIGATRADPQVVAVIARTLRIWSEWKLRTERELMQETTRRGESVVYLVPTEATMRALLQQMYGQASRLR